jgi:hypothetical protein
LGWVGIIYLIKPQVSPFYVVFLFTSPGFDGAETKGEKKKGEG